jgi:hypothetical protein
VDSRFRGNDGNVGEKDVEATSRELSCEFCMIRNVYH